MSSRTFKAMQMAALYGSPVKKGDISEPSECETCKGKGYYETLLSGFDSCATCLGTGYSLGDKDAVLEYQALMLRKARQLYKEQRKQLNELQQRYATQEQVLIVRGKVNGRLD